MGAWGAGLFSDDLALDVKSEYRDLIAGGSTAAEAKNTLVIQFESELNDADTDAVFWLALAATAWKLGRLDDDLRAKALGIIERGEGMELWDTPKLLRERQKALAKVAKQIASPQPPEVKVRKPKVYWTDWEIGEVIALKTLSNDWTLLHVVEHDDGPPHRFPVCELLSWRGKTLPPNVDSVNAASVEPLLTAIKGIPSTKSQRFVLLGADSRIFKERIVRIGMSRKSDKGLLARIFFSKRSKREVARHSLGIAYIDQYLNKLAQQSQNSDGG